MKLSKHEYMIVAGLVTLVTAMTVPSWFHLRDRFSRNASWKGMETLLNAAARYRLEYGMWPAIQQRGFEGDVRYGLPDLPNRELGNVLRAVDGPGNPGHELNPRRIPFLVLHSYRPGYAGLSNEGDMLDAWGTPYQIVLDTDMNSVCDVEDSIYGGGIDEGMIIWSCGPDRKSDTKDDILSWRR